MQSHSVIGLAVSGQLLMAVRADSNDRQQAGAWFGNVPPGVVRATHPAVARSTPGEGPRPTIDEVNRAADTPSMTSSPARCNWSRLPGDNPCPDFPRAGTRVSWHVPAKQQPGLALAVIAALVFPCGSEDPAADTATGGPRAARR
jgi:hypothetical protein